MCFPAEETAIDSAVYLSELGAASRKLRFRFSIGILLLFPRQLFTIAQVSRTCP